MYSGSGRRPSKSQARDVPEEKRSKPATSKRIRCGRCVPCITPDCGKCESCKKKRKFGGDGSSRQACIKRNCEAIHGTDSAPILSAPVKALPGVQAVNHKRKEPPLSSKASRASAQALPSEQTGILLDSSSDNNGVKSVNSKKKTPAKRSFTYMTKMEASFFPPTPTEKEKVHEIGKDDEVGDEENSELLPQEFKKRKKTLPTKYFRRFMGCKPPPPPELEACAKCGKDDDKPSNPILLCDGPNCDREYHLKCDGLEEIPEGDWFCVDCHKTGGGFEMIVDYLELMDERRSEYPNSSAFCMALAKGDLGGLKSNKVPESEIIKTHRDATPEQGWLLGKPVWIRLPKLKQHVPGRIINERPASQSDSDARSKTEEPGSIGAQEYLIRFSAGHFGRKETYYHWIRLEEHQLMIGDCFLWAWAADSNSGDSAPAFSVLRTSRDLILDLPRRSSSTPRSSTKSPAKKLAPEPVKSHSPEQQVVTRHNINTMAYFFHLGKFEKIGRIASDDFFDPSFLPEIRDSYGYPNAVAVAKAELQEQQSVIKWQKIPQGNPFHPAAFQSRDYFSLPPIIPLDRRQSTKANIELAEGEMHSKVCPLVMTGVDPSYIMDLLQKNHGVEPSKQLAASLSCQILPYRWPRKEFDVEESKPSVPGIELET